MSRRAPLHRPPGPRRILAALTALALAGCAREPALPSFLLISVDTLRADHLGMYGYARPTSPHIDAMAAAGVRYANAWAPTPWTLPSHAALLTGRHPFDLGIADVRSALPDAVPTLAERLSAAGYATAAFVDSGPRGFVGGERGFARGFDLYAHEPMRSHGFHDDMAASVDAALAWLDGRDRARPFLLFLHTKSVHTARARTRANDATAEAGTDAPYDKPEPWRSRFLPGGRLRFAWHDPSLPEIRGARFLLRMNEQLASGALAPGDLEAGRLEELMALYDGGIAYVDEHFGRLMDGLRERGLDASTVVVLTADHGESFLEHQFLLHVELHPPTLRVPLVLLDPRGPRGRVVNDDVGLVDVVPTLLARAGLALPRDLTGRPLPIADGAGAGAAPALSYYQYEANALYEGFALREGPWRLLLQRLRGEPEPRADLYDLRADPGEHAPVQGEPARELALRASLAARLAAPRDAPARSIELGPETREQLRELGYAP